MTKQHSHASTTAHHRAHLIGLLATLSLVLIGVACLVIPELIVDALPFLIGIPMAVGGVCGLISELAGRPDPEGENNSLMDVVDRFTLGESLVMAVFGFVILLHTHEAVGFIGMFWGFMGLQDAAREIDETLIARRSGHPWVLGLAWTLFELSLAVFLVISPFANIEHHVLLLGLELITFPFHIDSHDGKNHLKADM